MRKRGVITIFIHTCAFIVLVFLTGCLITKAPVPKMLPDTPLPLATSSAVVPSTKTPTMEVANATTTPTATRTIAVSPTNIPTALPVLPTLSPEDAKSKILELLSDNGGCKLPCVWGVNPADSTLQSVIRFTEQFGRGSKPGDYDINTSGNIAAVFWQGELRSFTRFSPLARKGNLAYIKLYAEFTREQGEAEHLSIKPVFGSPYFTQLFGNLLLPKILFEYGQPSQVLILPIDEDPDTPSSVNPLFSLVLFYQEQGFFIEYLFPKEKGINDYIGCPSKTAYFSLITWDPQNQPTLEDIVRGNSGLGINKYNFVRFKLLEQATSMTKDTFLHTFISENSRGCIETLQNLWENP